jgi:hypothetical protein
MILKTVAPFLKNEEFLIPEAGHDGGYNFSGMPIGLGSMKGSDFQLNLFLVDRMSITANCSTEGANRKITVLGKF